MNRKPARHIIYCAGYAEQESELYMAGELNLNKARKFNTLDDLYFYLLQEIDAARELYGPGPNYRPVEVHTAPSTLTAKKLLYTHIPVVTSAHLTMTAFAYVSYL